ncbi:MAG: thioredoxin domain-containing protein [Gammaproteobacteria bacterium]
MTKTTHNKNHLYNQTSPYLLQHVNNPVEWYPWCEKALKRAKNEKKPILLSIGYSACHWCHVMAHESFEDEATAKIMNELYINIKIDREERPDLDKIYQTAQFLLTQRSGGWPLTMFLTPEDQIPFFGGTYFPDTPRHGLPSFKELLHHISDFYQNRRSEITTQNRSMQNALKKIYEPEPTQVNLSETIFDTCVEQLEQNFDADHGGFGNAPKFPHPTNLERLLRYYAHNKINGANKPRALHAAIYSLEKMAAGGIYDHLGGGFSRYSVDQYWMIPHFEKMLYDNGPLLALYAQAFSLSYSEQFKNACEGTAEWLIREMQSPEGGYYSTLDADSEDVEGKYYVWDKDEIKKLLTSEEYSIFAPHFGLDGVANFEGQYHLHTFKTEKQVCGDLALSIIEFNRLLASAKSKLFVQREKRIRPDRDEKILTSWNALMVRGMIIAGRVLNNNDYIKSADRALNFIRNTMWKNQRLFATYKATDKESKAHLDAYLDDYAYLLDALLEILQVRWNTDDLNWACEIANVLLEKFEDSSLGGFYFTASDHEQLIQRPKTISDDSTPSGNGIAAFALARLGYLLAEPKYIEASERVIKFSAYAIHQSPLGHNSLLHAFEEQLHPPQIIILSGEKESLVKWHEACNLGYAPQRMVFSIVENEEDLPAAIAEKKHKPSSKEGVTAYVCQGMQCDTPVEHFSDLKNILAETSIQPPIN